MPDIGYTSAAGDGDQSLVSIRGNLITMTEAGEAGVTLTFRLVNNGGGTPNVKAGIFNAAGTVLLAESSVRTNITTENAYTFSGSGLATFEPEDATTYAICAIASSSDIRVLYDDVVAPGGARVTDQDASTFGPPMAFSGFGMVTDDTKSIIGYMTYTSGGGGAPPTIPESRKFGPKGFLRTIVNL